MQIIINNFGPIKKSSYDLDKDLLCVYGGNNIGKSYSMQLVYLLLKAFLAANNSRNYMFFYRTKDFDKACEDLINSFKRSKQNNTDISESVCLMVEKTLISIVGQTFFESCQNTFESLASAINENTVVSIVDKEYKIDFFIKKNSIELSNISPSVFLVSAKNYYHKSRQCGKKLSIYVVKEFDKYDAPKSVIIDFVYSQFARIISYFCRTISSVYFLPASRSGIYNGMSAFASIVAELSKNKAFLTRKIEFPGLTEPISDYFISLSSNKYLEKSKYSIICDEIENDILKGKVSYDKKENTLIYTGNKDGISLKMTEVSSMVSEIAPIVAFLKYKMEEIRRFYWRKPFNEEDNNVKPVIFIEEPEAHLHPENQIKLIKIFVKLVNCGVKIILSSHSNYIFNKLNNLILSNELDYKSYLPIIMTQENDGSVTSLMEYNELGVSDINFADVSYQLMEEREEIFDKLNGE